MYRRRFLQIFAGIGAFLTGLFHSLTTEAQVVSVTADPDSLTLGPGESATVMVNVDPASDYGIGSVSITVTVPPPYDGTIEGDTAVTVPAGQHWHITGDVNQTGDVFVEGLLTGIDTFHWQGNGFTVFFQNGGQADLRGVPKARWGPWGTDPTGWVAGDRIAVAPTAVGVYVPSETVWSDWSMARPPNSPDVTLVDGSVAKPEVVNLSQSIVFENLSRGFHFHDSAGVQNLSDVKFLNCGTPGVLASYPVHFHLLGDNSRGTVLERVVVEGGKNHAFVPHGSHGISFPGCVAYNTKGVAFWWDRTMGDTANNSDDINWDDCLSILSTTSTLPGETNRLAGFWLSTGAGNSCRRAVAIGVPGTPGSGSRQKSGFHWPEDMSVEEWVFADCVAHNNRENGIFVWQNTDVEHLVESFTGFNNGFADVNHGAYANLYVYREMNLNSRIALVQHAKTVLATPLIPLAFENIETSGVLLVAKHQSDSSAPSYHRHVAYSRVIYQEGINKGAWTVFENCGLQPADFVLTGPHPADLADILPSDPIHINPASIIEIFEGGTLSHRWAAGVWS